MVKIRLARKGAKKRPFYHILVTDSRSRHNGCTIERLGFFNPLATGNEVTLKMDAGRVEYWLGQGAKTTERAAHLIKKYNKEYRPEAQQ